MTREIAIKAIQDFIGWFKEDSLIRKALEMAIQALEQNESAEEWYKLFVKKLDEQEPCDDAVSRDAFITRYREWMKSEYGKIPDDDTLAIRVIKSLPSVTQKSGKWIPVSERLPEEREWYLAVFKEKDTAYQLIPRVADYIGNGENKWQIIDEEGLGKEYIDILECIAWMPLPKPYEPQESEVDGNE